MPAIGVDEAAELDDVDHEPLETGGVDVRDVPQADTADPARVHLDGDDNDQPVDRAAPEDPGRLYADVRLVDFDLARQPVPIGTDHRPPELMEPRPSRLVAPEPQDSSPAERAGPVLLARDLPGREQPAAQLARTLEDCPRGRGHLPSARGTHVEASLRAPGGGRYVALRADEALRPPQALQVRDARLLVGEELTELNEVPGLVDTSSGLGRRRVDHRHSL